MADLSKVAVVILNYNTRDLLARFLPTLINFSGEAKIVVADNASTDDSVAYVKKHHPTVTCIELQENYGFCKGYNEAFKQIDTEYSILLNSDVEVTENWLDPLVALLETDTSIAACQPKINAYHLPTDFEHAGAAGGFIDFLGYPFCRGRIFDTVEKDNGQYNDERQVFWASGACMCVRTHLFKQFGGFDEDFFAHMEEIDLCWRWQSAGFKIFYTPKSKVFHIGGGTLSYNNPRKVYFNFRNGLFLLFKNLPASKLIYIIWLRMLLDGLAGLKFFSSGSLSNFLSVLKAHIHFYMAIPSLIKKRNKSDVTIAGATIDKQELIYLKSIVLSYFLKKKKKFSELNWKSV